MLLHPLVSVRCYVFVAATAAYAEVYATASVCAKQGKESRREADGKRVRGGGEKEEKEREKPFISKR